MFGSLKNFGPKTNLGPEKNLGPYNIKDPKEFVFRKIQAPKIFGAKK